MQENYETYAVRPTGFYGLNMFVRFVLLPGEMGRHPPRPGKRPVTSKSESVGFSWDPTDLRAIFGSFSRGPRDACFASGRGPSGRFLERASLLVHGAQLSAVVETGGFGGVREVGQEGLNSIE
jgi:hypothetical protein